MERKLWKSLYVIIRFLDKRWGSWKYSTSDILAVYLWAVVHDRPMSWATQTENWPEDLKPKHFPSQSTLSRRMRRDDVWQLLTQVETTWLVVACMKDWWMHIIDAKGLPIGSVSKDADAGYGRCGRGMAKGYKLFVVWGKGPLPLAWALGPMNKSEKMAARDLIPELPGCGYLVGDTEYDSNVLYDLAQKADYQLVVRKRLPHSKGLGNHYQSPYRLRSIDLLKRKFGKGLFRFQKQIERDFGNLTAFGGGLGPLPAWVRRFHRVRNWVQSKILINAVRWFQRNHPIALAIA